jgi:hypothetical protein
MRQPLEYFYFLCYFEKKNLHLLQGLTAVLNGGGG